MPNVGRVVGMLSLAGALGLCVAICGAAAPTEPVRNDLPAPPVEPGGYILSEPLPVEPAVPAPRASKGTKAAQREALIAQLLPILEKTRSATTFMMTLEALVALDAPAEKVVPVCLRALESLDEFKPLPTEKDMAQIMLLEAVGESLKTMIDKKVKVVKGANATADRCYPGHTLPAPMYLEHLPQYLPPDHPLLRPATPPSSAEALFIEAGRIFDSVVGGMIGSSRPPMNPAYVPPEPVAIPTEWSRPTSTEPVPVRVPACPPRPTSHSPWQSSSSAQPIPTTVPASATVEVESTTSIIPVGTLPAPSLKIESLPPRVPQPGRLVPVPQEPR